MDSQANPSRENQLDKKKKKSETQVKAVTSEAKEPFNYAPAKV